MKKISCLILALFSLLMVGCDAATTTKPSLSDTAQEYIERAKEDLVENPPTGLGLWMNELNIWDRAADLIYTDNPEIDIRLKHSPVLGEFESDDRSIGTFDGETYYAPEESAIIKGVFEKGREQGKRAEVVGCVSEGEIVFFDLTMIDPAGAAFNEMERDLAMRMAILLATELPPDEVEGVVAKYGGDNLVEEKHGEWVIDGILVDGLESGITCNVHTFTDRT